MKGCFNCKKPKRKTLYKCPDCGAIYCENCATKTKKICPICYSDLDFGN